MEDQNEGQEGDHAAGGERRGMGMLFTLLLFAGAILLLILLLYFAY